MALKDIDARREYTKRYYAENAEMKKQKALEWYYEHKNDPDFQRRRDAYNLKWRAENREAYLAMRKRSRLKRDADPARQEENRRKERELWRIRTDKLIALANEAKSGGCIECGQMNVECLDFHHRDPLTKSFDIGKAIQRSVKVEVLLAEIAKCDVICANCHIKHHADDPSPKRRPLVTRKSIRDAELRSEKQAHWEPFFSKALARGCTLCPGKDATCLQFHHVDPGEKSFNVHRYTFMPLTAPIREEVMKCMVLCANCHRLHHKELVQLPDISLDRYWAERLGS